LASSAEGPRSIAAASERPQNPDSSLDPADWPSFRALAHRVLDEALDHVQDVRQRPVWTPMPPEVVKRLAEPLPTDGQSAEKVSADLADLILPYGVGNTHPRFFGWVHGCGTASGLLPEMIAAAMNANVGGRDHGAVHVERQVLTWCRQLFGFPDGASGLLVSGTSMATLIGLTVARNSASASARIANSNFWRRWPSTSSASDLGEPDSRPPVSIASIPISLPICGRAA